jgi:hypothetical protein
MDTRQIVERNIQRHGCTVRLQALAKAITPSERRRCKSAGLHEMKEAAN